MMRWVFLSFKKYSEESNPENWLKSIVHYTGILDSLAENNEVTSLDGISFKGIQMVNGVRYNFIDRKGLGLLFCTLKYIKTLNPDIILIHSFQFPIQSLILRLWMGNGVKFLIQNHAERPPQNLKSWAQRALDPFIHGYLFCSREMGLAWVNSGIIKNPNKIHEVMEVSSDLIPIEKDSARNRTLVKGNPVFLWVGRLDKNKDPQTVIEGFLNYSIGVPEARLYMIFQSEMLLKPVQELLEKKSSVDKVILVGKVPRKELVYWYNSADFFISGSHYEGSGTAACEAMSCGCIPILTNIDSFRMMTKRGKIGYLFEAGNSDSLFEILIHLSLHELPQKRLEVLSHFESQLSFKAISKKFQEIASLV